MEDPLKKNLKIDLLESEFGFWSDFLDVGMPQVEDSRPVGVPQVFMPLDRCGYLIHRRGKSANAYCCSFRELILLSCGCV
jgi:hypothetical protein